MRIIHETYELKSVNFELGIQWAFMQQPNENMKMFANVCIVYVIPSFRCSWSGYCYRCWVYEFYVHIIAQERTHHSYAQRYTSITTVPLIVYLILCHFMMAFHVHGMHGMHGIRTAPVKSFTFCSLPLFAVCFYSHIFIQLNKRI